MLRSLPHSDEEALGGADRYRAVVAAHPSNVPQFVEGLSDVVRNPIHTTGVGLLLYSKQALEAKAEAST